MTSTEFWLATRTLVHDCNYIEYFHCLRPSFEYIFYSYIVFLWTSFFIRKTLKHLTKHIKEFVNKRARPSWEKLLCWKLKIFPTNAEKKANLKLAEQTLVEKWLCYFERRDFKWSCVDGLWRRWRHNFIILFDALPKKVHMVKKSFFFKK